MIRWLFDITSRLFNEYDVFISYSHKDRNWVRKLACDLSNRGFNVFLDEERLKIGHPWPQQLMRAATRSRKAIFVLSPNFIEARNPYVELGILFAHTRGKEGSLIPVLYEDSDFPAFLASTHGVDFRKESGRTYLDSFEQLCSALGERSGRPRGSVVTTSGISLRFLFVLILGVTFFSSFAAGAVSLWNQASQWSRLRETQEGVQKIDARIAVLAQTTEGSVAKYTGDYTYYDPQSGEKLATDTWEKGKLTCRVFYQQGRMAAADEFEYSGNVVNGKKRVFADEQRRIFLEDNYTQAGVLRLKRYYPKGRKDLPIDLTDDLRSPLPPPSILFYR